MRKYKINTTRLFHFCYSWGAAIVILGVLFRLMNFPYGNGLLFTGMITEFLVFFISAFDVPAKTNNEKKQSGELTPLQEEQNEATRLYLKQLKEASGRMETFNHSITQINEELSRIQEKYTRLMEAITVKQPHD